MLLNALHDLSIINNFPTNLIALFTFSVCGSGKTNVSAPPKQWQRNLIRFSLDIHLRIRGGRRHFRSVWWWSWNSCRIVQSDLLSHVGIASERGRDDVKFWSLVSIDVVVVRRKRKWRIQFGEFKVFDGILECREFYQIDESYITCFMFNLWYILTMGVSKIFVIGEVNGLSISADNWERGVPFPHPGFYSLNNLIFLNSDY